MPHSKIPIYMYILNEKIIFEKKKSYNQKSPTDG